MTTLSLAGPASECRNRPTTLVLIVMLAMPLLAVVGLWLWPRSNLLLATIMSALGSEGLRSLAAYTLTATGAVVAAIVPLSILAITWTSSRIGSHLLPVVLRRAGHPFQPLALGIALLFFFAVLTPVAIRPWCPGLLGVALALAGGWAFLVLLLLTLRMLFQVLRALSDRGIFELLAGAMTRNARSELISEARYRVGTSMFDKLKPEASSDGPERQPAGPPVLVRSRRVGTIFDIDLRNVADTRAMRSLCGIRCAVHLHKQLNDRVRKGDVVATLRGGRHGRVSGLLIRHLVRRTYRIKAIERRSASDLRSLSDSLVDLSVRAFKETHTMLLEGVLDLFLRAYRDYMEIANRTGIRFRADQLDQFGSEFWVTQLLQHSLREIIESAVAQDQRRLPLVVSGKLSGLLREAVENRDLMVFHSAITLHVFLYWAARRLGRPGSRAIMQHRALDNLESCLDWAVLPKLGKSANEREIAQWLPFLTRGIEGFESLLQHSLSAGDEEFYKRVDRTIDQILEHWPGVLQLDDDTGDVVAEELERIPQLVQAKQTQIRLEACAFLLQGIAAEQSQGTFTTRAFNQLSERFDGAADLLSAVADRLGGRQKDRRWSIWEEVEDTKKVTWSDPRRRYVLFLVVRGLNLSRQNVTWPETLPGPLRPSLELIEELAQEVANGRERFASVLPAVSDEDIDVLLEKLKTMGQKAEDRIRERVSSAEISSVREDLLKTGFREPKPAVPTILDLVERSGRLRTAAGSVEGVFLIQTTHRLPKIWLTEEAEAPGESEVVRFGSEIGELWRTCEETAFLGQLFQHCREEMVASPEALVRLLDDRCDPSKSGTVFNFIVADVGLRRHLHTLNGFVYANAEEREAVGNNGSLRGIPVFLRRLESRQALLAGLDAAETDVILSKPRMEVTSTEGMTVRVKRKAGGEEEPCVEVKIVADLRVMVGHEAGLQILEAGPSD